MVFESTRVGDILLGNNSLQDHLSKQVFCQYDIMK